MPRSTVKRHRKRPLWYDPSSSKRTFLSLTICKTNKIKTTHTHTHTLFSFFSFMKSRIHLCFLLMVLLEPQKKQKKILNTMQHYTLILDGYRNFPVASSITKFLMPEFYSTAYAVQTPATVHLIQLPDPCFKKLRVGHLFSSVSSCEMFVLFSSPVVLKKGTDDC